MGLKVKDICDLIKASGDAKVKELKFGDLHVIFAPEANGLANQDSFTESTVISGQDFSNEQQAYASDERRIKDLQMELALIENPAEYERMVLAGELEDGEEAHD